MAGGPGKPGPLCRARHFYHMSTLIVEPDTQTRDTPAIPFKDRPRPLVYVGASAYEWKAECHFIDSLVSAMEHCHSRIIRDWGVGDAAIGRKRNYQAWRFLTQTNAEFLFFIDSDIVFEPVHFDRIVSHNLPVCAGIYFKKSAKLEPVIEGNLSEEDPVTHLMKVRSAGTGFLCIRRDVFEKIRDMMLNEDPDNFCYEGDPDPETRWDFFPFGSRKRSYRSEDWYFCDLARRAGFDIHVDCSVQLGHVGKTIFPLMRMGHEDVADLLFHKYGYTKEQIKEWLLAAPEPANFKEEK